MRKRHFAILGVVVAIVSIVSLGLTCAPDVHVEATICDCNEIDQPWTGPVTYTITDVGTTTPHYGTTVPWGGFDGNDGSAFTLLKTSVSGGPAGYYIYSVDPSEQQTLPMDGEITFILNFHLKQDAAIQFLTWTINGTPVQGIYNVTVCQILDAHFQQWVAGCEGYNVTMNETSWLQITQTQGPAPAMVVVVDDWCAVNKTAVNQTVPHEKVSQVPSVNNQTVSQNYSIPLALNVSTLLDVETQWQLVKCVNYTKSINWLGISKAPFVEAHPCVLFELVLPGPGLYAFMLQTSADVALVGDVDANPNNNDSGWSDPLYLIVALP